MPRTEYSQQLHELRAAVVELASMVDKAIAGAMLALQQQDVDRAREIVVADQRINDLRWRTEEQALLVIATQAPLASDLRTIAAIIHIITDLERMADHAAGIAKIVVETAQEPLLKPLIDLPRMAELTRGMLSNSISAFIDEDAHAARLIAARDDVVDRLYDQIYRELLTYMMADPTTINRATHLLWVAHNLERIADRVTNICERVVFTVTGVMEEGMVSTY